MATQPIFGPFLAMMALTVVVWAYMYARRIPFIRSLDLPPDRLTPAELARLSPPAVSNPSDNLKNLFEMPVLFYALVLYLGLTGSADSGHVTAAWLFVLFRVLHSAVHCTVNVVMVRFALYALSCLCLFVMLARVVLAYLG